MGKPTRAPDWDYGDILDAVGPNGVPCPTCHGKQTRVLEARAGRGYTRRRYRCLSDRCAAVRRKRRIAGHIVLIRGTRWTTYEFFSPRRGVVIVPDDLRTSTSV